MSTIEALAKRAATSPKDAQTVIAEVRKEREREKNAYTETQTPTTPLKHTRHTHTHTHHMQTQCAKNRTGVELSSDLCIR